MTEAGLARRMGAMIGFNRVAESQTQPIAADDSVQVYVKTEEGWGAETSIGEVKPTEGELIFLNRLERAAKRIKLTEENSTKRKK